MAQKINANDLGLGGASATVAALETTASVSYVQLATTTDQVTVTVPSTGVVLFGMFCQAVNSTTGINLLAYDISGANTTAAADATVIGFSTSTGETSIGACRMLTGLAAGSTTFKMFYRVNAGTGSFERRHVFAIPLG